MRIKFQKTKEKTVYKLFYKIVRQETTIETDFIQHLYNLLAILLKIKLFEEEKVNIAGLGSFYLYKLKNKTAVRFKMFKSLKRTIHGLKELNFRKKYTSYKTLNNLFINCSKCTGLKTKHVAFIFHIWMFSLIKTLLHEKGCKVKGIGLLYLCKLNHEKCGIKRNVKHFYRVRLLPYKRTIFEANNQKELYQNKRVKSLLIHNKINIK